LLGVVVLFYVSNIFCSRIIFRETGKARQHATAFLSGILNKIWPPNNNHYYRLFIEENTTFGLKKSIVLIKEFRDRRKNFFLSRKTFTSRLSRFLFGAKNLENHEWAGRLLLSEKGVLSRVYFIKCKVCKCLSFFWGRFISAYGKCPATTCSCVSFFTFSFHNLLTEDCDLASNGFAQYYRVKTSPAAVEIPSLSSPQHHLNSSSTWNLVLLILMPWHFFLFSSCISTFSENSRTTSFCANRDVLLYLLTNRQFC